MMRKLDNNKIAMIIAFIFTIIIFIFCYNKFYTKNAFAGVDDTPGFFNSSLGDGNAYLMGYSLNGWESVDCTISWTINNVFYTQTFSGTYGEITFAPPSNGVVTCTFKARFRYDNNGSWIYKTVTQSPQSISYGNGNITEENGDGNYEINIVTPTPLPVAPDNTLPQHSQLVLTHTAEYLSCNYYYYRQDMNTCVVYVSYNCTTRNTSRAIRIRNASNTIIASVVPEYGQHTVKLYTFNPNNTSTIRAVTDNGLTAQSSALPTNYPPFVDNTPTLIPTPSPIPPNINGGVSGGLVIGGTVIGSDYIDNTDSDYSYFDYLYFKDDTYGYQINDKVLLAYLIEQYPLPFDTNANQWVAYCTLGSMCNDVIVMYRTNEFLSDEKLVICAPDYNSYNQLDSMQSGNSQYFKPAFFKNEDLFTHSSYPTNHSGMYGLSYELNYKCLKFSYPQGWVTYEPEYSSKIVLDLQYSLDVCYLSNVDTYIINCPSLCTYNGKKYPRVDILNNNNNTLRKVIIALNGIIGHSQTLSAYDFATLSIGDIANNNIPLYRYSLIYKPLPRTPIILMSASTDLYYDVYNNGWRLKSPTSLNTSLYQVLSYCHAIVPINKSANLGDNMVLQGVTLSGFINKDKWNDRTNFPKGQGDNLSTYPMTLYNTFPAIYLYDNTITSTISYYFNNTGVGFYMTPTSGAQNPLDSLSTSNVTSIPLYNVISRVFNDLSVGLKNLKSNKPVNLMDFTNEDGAFKDIGSINAFNIDWFDKVKPYSDLIISAFLWGFFIFYVLKNGKRWF